MLPWNVTSWVGPGVTYDDVIIVVDVIGTILDVRGDVSRVDVVSLVADDTDVDNDVGCTDVDVCSANDDVLVLDVKSPTDDVATGDVLVDSEVECKTDEVVTGDDVIDVDNVADGVGNSETDVVEVTTGIDVGT